MENQDVYNIGLKVCGQAKEIIEDFRLQKTGTPLVDFQAPHLTIKRKFSLKPNIDEAQIINIIEHFTLSPTVVEIENVKQFGDACVLTSKSEYLRSKHSELLTLLEPLVDSLSLVWEGENFMPHITLFRSQINELDTSFSDLNIHEVLLSELSLYRYDSNPIKKYSYEIFSRKLN